MATKSSRDKPTTLKHHEARPFPNVHLLSLAVYETEYRLHPDPRDPRGIRCDGLAADIKTDGLSLHRNGNSLDVKTEIVLDDLRLKNNHQIYITPVISDDKGNATTLPAVLVNGRNMQIAIERNILKETTDRHPDVAYSVRRHNGKPQAVSYTASVPLLPWMIKPGAQISFPVDSCGCGVDLGSAPATGTPLNLNPAGEMKRVYITPSVTELPVAVHEGKARVQFEVDRTVLHDAPYRTRNGQLIDNRKELQIIDDSIRYSLTDPNVEIAAVDIVGYASPESPYLHNEELATAVRAPWLNTWPTVTTYPARPPTTTPCRRTGENSAKS